jgi:CRP-like cAMP-binding protein
VGSVGCRPWFGELALWESKPRAATAVCLDPVKCLVLTLPHFERFLEIVPTFRDMFSMASSAFTKMNKLDGMHDAVTNVQALAARTPWQQLACHHREMK